MKAQNIEKTQKTVKISIPFFGGRPDRENVIGKDDILNLRIALNTATSFEQFLQKV